MPAFTHWDYLPEFIGFATVHVLSLISPGPDFLMVLRSSLRDTRKNALFVALGIASGEAIHVTYTLLGLGILVHESTFAMTLLQYVGGIYLVYIGIQSLRAKAVNVQPLVEYSPNQAAQGSFMQSWRQGFLTNVLNVKAAFFTISCFAVFVSPHTPSLIRVGYGVFIVVTTILWFATVAICLTHVHVQKHFMGIKHWIERICGGLLVALGTKLAFGNKLASLWASIAS